LTAWKPALLALAAGFGLSVAVGSTAAAQAVGWGPPLCDVEVDLLGMVYVVDEPEQSFALVGLTEAKLVRIGSFVAAREVLEMEPRSLLLGPAEDPCLLRLSHAGKQRVTPKPRPRRRKPRSRRR